MFAVRNEVARPENPKMTELLSQLKKKTGRDLEEASVMGDVPAASKSKPIENLASITEMEKNKLYKRLAELEAIGNDPQFSQAIKEERDVMDARLARGNEDTCGEKYLKRVKASLGRVKFVDVDRMKNYLRLLPSKRKQTISLIKKMRKDMATIKEMGRNGYDMGSYDTFLKVMPGLLKFWDAHSKQWAKDKKPQSLEALINGLMRGVEKKVLACKEEFMKDADRDAIDEFFCDITDENYKRFGMTPEEKANLSPDFGDTSSGEDLEQAMVKGGTHV